MYCIGRSDGVVEVWDLLDKSHIPSTTQNVTSTAISYIKFQQNAGRNGSQFIAVGDDDGTLHILETPRNLQRPSKNEKSAIGIFFERETRRLTSTFSRKQERIRARATFETDAVNV